jgi:type IV secretory pathway protease TraF
MGDNRAGSRDSRSFGSITKSEIVGRVFLRIWPPNRLGLL